MPPATVVFAVGNRSRGDDAIAPLLLERLASWLAHTGQSDGFALIEDYQLQIEHALDLRGKRLALFIDAGWRTRSPLAFYAIGAERGAASGATHQLPPQGVLQVYRKVVQAEPPPAFVLCVRGDRFELGEGLSVSARANAESAWLQLMRLCGRAEAAHWQALADTRQD